VWRAGRLVLGAAALSVLACLASGNARAALFTEHFAGEVIEVRLNELGVPIAVGDPYMLTFTFESATPDSNTGDPINGVYEGLVVNAAVSIGSFVFPGTAAVPSVPGVVRGVPAGGSVSLFDDFATGAPPLLADSWNMLLGHDPVVFASLVQTGVFLTEFHGDGGPLPSEALPTDIDLLDWTTNRSAALTLAEGLDSSLFIIGLVPEPGTAVLLATCLVTLAGRRRSGGL